MNRQVVGTIALCTTVLTAAAAGTARASCGISEIAAAATAASSGQLPAARHLALVPGSANAFATEPSYVPSIVGLWHTSFSIDVNGAPVDIQEAFQLWNVGGTEIHNPNVDPRQGNVCLGVWQQTGPRTFTLTHRVWAWDTNGGFGGTLHLSETLTVAKNGRTFSGTFTLDIYDPSGAFVDRVAGTATGERIAVGDQ